MVRVAHVWRQSIGAALIAFARLVETQCFQLRNERDVCRLGGDLYFNFVMLRRQPGHRPDQTSARFLTLRQRMTASRLVVPHFNFGEFLNRFPKTIYTRE
jgi:hypothetical protein